jgi:hypothetical protein
MKGKNIVPSRAVSRQRIAEHVPAAADAHATLEERYFLLGSMKGVTRGTIEARIGSWNRAAVFREDLGTEAEELALLEAVTRKHLVKTSAGLKNLA